LQRVVELTFAGAQAGDEFIIDDDNRIPEIAEVNNRVTLR
jgi:hypothetical protein